MLPSVSSLLSSVGGCGFIRPSRRSLSGFVFVALFRSAPAAHCFALLWARALPVVCRGVVVRRVAGGFAVSVPVAVGG